MGERDFLAAAGKLLPISGESGMALGLGGLVVPQQQESVSPCGCSFLHRLGITGVPEVTIQKPVPARDRKIVGYTSRGCSRPTAPHGGAHLVLQTTWFSRKACERLLV